MRFVWPVFAAFLLVSCASTPEPGAEHEITSWEREPEAPRSPAPPALNPKSAANARNQPGYSSQTPKGSPVSCRSFCGARGQAPNSSSTGDSCSCD